MAAIDLHRNSNMSYQPIKKKRFVIYLNKEILYLAAKAAGEERMYECPNCAGNLKFNIVKQQLYCDYCDTQVDPYHFYKERDAQEAGDSSGEYQVTIFTCPQCGGQIVSEDTTAATFCSFCGASTILDSRISRERRPELIIPFTKTKEDCKAAYKKMLHRAVFAPKELKDENLIEKFRGIYMPYWVYSFEKKGPITFPGRKTYRRGNYRITEQYRLDCEIEAEYEGLAYDASSTFSDSLSNAIAPFDLRKGKDFVPSFLSGFYGDTNDVEKHVYLPEAEEVVIQDASRFLLKNPVCRKCHAGREEGWFPFRNALRPSNKTVKLAMLPVWFLAYRNGDRVSYVAVNGQTGKAAGDLPVDGKRYLAGSLLMAIPLFFLFNLFLTITPQTILLIAAVLAFFCAVILNRQLTYILARESGEDDKGLASVRPVYGTENSGWKKRRRIWKPWESSMGKVVLLLALFYATALIPSLALHMAKGRLMDSQTVLFFVSAAMFIGIHVFLTAIDNRRKRQNKDKKTFGGHFKEKWPVLRKPFGGIVSAAVILLFNPVSDWFYYIGAFFCMGTVFWAIIDMIRQHNMLAARKPPQLNSRGGEENEQSC